MSPLPHGECPRVGMVGAGQLARMTYQAAIPLGLSLCVLAATPDDGAALVAHEVMIGSPDSAEALEAFARTCDVVSFDHELVDTEILGRLEAAGHRVRPSSATMAIAQNKEQQRRLFADRGLPVPPFRRVASAEDLIRFGAEFGWPVVGKAIRGGYDGRGVWVVPDEAAAARLVAEAAGAGVLLLAEQWVPIDRELAILIARRPGGEMVTYPLIQTVQIDAILHELIVPAEVPADLAAEADGIGRAVAEAVGVTGILAVELFLSGGRLLINEIATRPHNSGHFSIEGSLTSQFENHLRAVLDWPLGPTDPVAPAAVTVNVLAKPHTGDLMARLPAALAVPGARVHLYGKAARPGRKVGHVTALAETAEAALATARRAAAIVAGDPDPEGA